MKIVYSYYNYDGNGPSEFLLKCAKLSLLSLRVCCPDLEAILYTTHDCVKYFANFEIVNYDEIIESDFNMKDIDSRYWNYSKIWTYAHQDEPFLHIDFDTVILDNFTIPDTDVVVERARPYEICDDIQAHSIEGCLLPSKLLCSGFIGGKNLDIFKELYEYATIRCSKEYNKDIDVSYEHLNSIEELAFSQLVAKNKLNYDVLTPGRFVHMWTPRSIDKEEACSANVESLLNFFTIRKMHP